MFDTEIHAESIFKDNFKPYQLFKDNPPADKDVLVGYSDLQVLELILSYAMPARGTHSAAKNLLAKYESLSAICDAPHSELLKIRGVSENAAIFLRLIPQTLQKILVSKSRNGYANDTDLILDNSQKAADFFIPRFIAMSTEAIMVVCLNPKGKIITLKMFDDGNVDSAAVNSRKVMELALLNHASGIMLAHNHPSSTTTPSNEDKVTTHKLWATLNAVGISLIDHIIVCGKKYFSFRDNNMINN